MFTGLPGIFVIIFTAFQLLRKNSWEPRMILWLALLSLLEAVSVCAWLGYTYDWVWTPNKESWMTWIGVWASFIALNEIGYWFMQGELKRAIKDDLDGVRDARRELKEGQNADVLKVKDQLRIAENERSDADFRKDAAIAQTRILEGQLGDAIRMRDNYHSENFVLQNLAKISGNRLGQDLISTGDPTTPWRYVKKEVPPNSEA